MKAECSSFSETRLRPAAPADEREGGASKQQLRSRLGDSGCGS